MRISDWSSDVCSSDLLLDRRIIDDFALECGASDLFAWSISDELQRAHRVAADRGKEAIGVGATGTDCLGDAAAQGFGVREQVLKDRRNRLTTIGVFPQRQRERNRKGLLPAQPCLVVTKIDRAARLLCPVPDEAVVQVDQHRCVLAATGTQNSASIS